MRMTDEDEVGLKEKPEDTQKDYIEIRPEEPRVRAKELDPNLLLGLWNRESSGASCLKAPSGCEMSRPGGAYNRVLNGWVSLSGYHRGGIQDTAGSAPPCG